jgi:hypothetical protein
MQPSEPESKTNGQHLEERGNAVIAALAGLTEIAARIEAAVAEIDVRTDKAMASIDGAEAKSLAAITAARDAAIQAVKGTSGASGAGSVSNNSAVASSNGRNIGNNGGRVATKD